MRSPISAPSGTVEEGMVRYGCGFEARVGGMAKTGKICGDDGTKEGDWGEELGLDERSRSQRWR